MGLRKFSQAVFLLLSVGSVLVAGAMIVERAYWRWLQGVKIGESTNDWPFISISSFWMSFPWLAVTLGLAAFSWDPTPKRWLRRALMVLALVEAVTIWWMASSCLRPDPT